MRADVDREDFTLRDDDTMRRLRAISQSPGELAWRMELLATLERMRTQAEVSTRAILQSQKALEKSISHLTPTKLTALVNRELEEKLRPRDRDVHRLWKASVWLLEKAATIGIGVVCTLLGLKAMKP